MHGHGLIKLAKIITGASSSRSSWFKVQLFMPSPPNCTVKSCFNSPQKPLIHLYLTVLDDLSNNNTWGVREMSEGRRGEGRGGIEGEGGRKKEGEGDERK
jgi:hypothetical protein